MYAAGVEVGHICEEIIVVGMSGGVAEAVA